MIYKTCTLQFLESVVYSMYSEVVLKYRFFGTKTTIKHSVSHIICTKCNRSHIRLNGDDQWGTLFYILLYTNLWPHFKLIFFDISQVNGIKAISSFAIIPKFDLALGFPVDWMHCVLLGVSKSLINFWILSKYHKENFYLGNKVRFYNHNFNNMKNLSVFYCFHKLSIKKNISRNNYLKLCLLFKAHDSQN